LATHIGTPLRGASVTPLTAVPSAAASLDRLAFYVLLLYFAVQPFNDAMHRIVLLGGYTDLLWSIAFLGLTVIVLATNRTRSAVSFELAIVLVWVAYLSALFLVSDNDKSPEEGALPVAAYNLRWAVQPIPIFILVAVRGLDRNELNSILTTVVLATPISICVAYLQHGATSLSDVQYIADSGFGISYNTYVPYTTFPLFAAIYLWFQLKNPILRLLVLCSASIITLFLFANPSRQSVLFALGGAALVFAFTRSARNLLAIGAVAGIVAFSIARMDMVDRVMTRFFSSEGLLKSDRGDRLFAEIDAMTDSWQWIAGKGLDLTLDNSNNPHNNYMASIMRTGLIGMVLMFLPFVRALFRLVVGFVMYGRRPWFDRNLAVFVMLALLFLLYHSCFGYPHLDSLNGPVVWLGLGIAVVYNADLRKRAAADRQLSSVGDPCGARSII
jgi:hypothetical protein